MSFHGRVFEANAGYQAPLGEMYGRRVVFFVTFAALTGFNAGTAAAKNIETVLVLRLLGGTFGSSPFTNAGGVIADIFNTRERGFAMCIFAVAPFMGPGKLAPAGLPNIPQQEMID